MAFGAGAVELLKSGQTAVMTAFVPPDIEFLPLKEAIRKVRTVPPESEFLGIAQSLGIYLGTPL
jgi:6-phosphofructokinase 1